MRLDTIMLLAIPALIISGLISSALIKEDQKSKLKYAVGVVFFIITMLLFVSLIIYKIIGRYFISHGRLVITVERVEIFIFATILTVLAYIVFIAIAESGRK